MEEEFLDYLKTLPVKKAKLISACRFACNLHRSPLRAEIARLRLVEVSHESPLQADPILR